VRQPGADLVGLRPVMTFGVGRFSGAVGILNQAFRDAAVSGHGTVTRPWAPRTSINPMYVADCADLVVRSCLHEAPLARSTYNMGTGEYLEIQAMVDEALRALPKGSAIDFRESALPGAPETVPWFDYPDVDSRALRQELAWSPRYDFASAVGECIRSYRTAGPPARP